MSRPVLIVIDTNVVVSALQSAKGASYHVLRKLEADSIQLAMSVPLFLEYEEVIRRFVVSGRISSRAMELMLDYLCAHALTVEVHYLWRPSLADANDEMVLEAAIAAGSRWIVTHNIRDFACAAELGIRAITPGQFLKTLESLP